MTPEEFWNILHSMPEPKPTLFRLYYDDQGYPIEYSHEDREGNYIDIDPESFRLQSYNVRVINNQIVIVEKSTRLRKIVPSEFGTSCDPRDVCVIIDKEPNIKWKLKYYDSN